jgi:hypothetical protein
MDLRRRTPRNRRIPKLGKSVAFRIKLAEDQSVAQVCEALLRSGLVSYQKEGTKHIRRFLSRHEIEP